jgi:hypothetical protein
MAPLLLSHIEVPACALSVAPLLLVTGSALPLLPMLVRMQPLWLASLPFGLFAAAEVLRQLAEG